MEKAFKKQLGIWKKAVLKYRLSSSDASNEITELLRRIRDSGDQDMVKRVTRKYSKFFSLQYFNFYVKTLTFACQQISVKS